MPVHGFPSLRLIEHPLVQDSLTRLRDRRCDVEAFRRLLREIGLLMGVEVTRDLPLRTVGIETPLTVMQAPVLGCEVPAIVAILRAALPMAEGMHALMPAAPMGHIGLYRDHATLHPVEYLVRLPEPGARPFILVDPMLATGNSLVHAIGILNRHGVADARIRVLSLLAAPEGVRHVAARHPQVQLYTAALDERLDGNGYIVPGLGDAGDRAFGTG